MGHQIISNLSGREVEAVANRKGVYPLLHPDSRLDLILPDEGPIRPDIDNVAFRSAAKPEGRVGQRRKDRVLLNRDRAHGESWTLDDWALGPFSRWSATSAHSIFLDGCAVVRTIPARVGLTNIAFIQPTMLMQTMREAMIAPTGAGYDLAAVLLAPARTSAACETTSGSRTAWVHPADYLAPYEAENETVAENVEVSAAHDVGWFDHAERLVW